jgi:hypothetical protein
METTVMSGSQVMLKDLSGYGNKGVCYNSWTAVDCNGWSGWPQIVNGNGKSGKAMSFDGLSDYINIFPSYWYPDSWASTVLIKHRSTSKPLSGQYLFSDACWWEFKFQINSNNQFWGFVYQTWSYVNIISQKDYLWVMIIDIANKEIEFYSEWIFIWKNTFVIGNGLRDFPYSIWKAGTNVNCSTDKNYFNWLIDEVRIYNRALSDSEIQALYNATK